MSVTTSVSTLTSTLGWASHLLLSLSFLTVQVVFSSAVLLSFLFLRVTNQVPALSEVKIEGNRNNLGANLKIQKNIKNPDFDKKYKFLLFRFLGKTHFLESCKWILTLFACGWLDKPLIQIRSIKKGCWHLHCEKSGIELCWSSKFCVATVRVVKKYPK